MVKSYFAKQSKKIFFGVTSCLFLRVYTRKRSPFYENWVLTEQFAFGKIVTGGGVAIFCHPY
ncbi:MAG: hypothetical protein J6V69_02700 [Clostridia bacterium]|nr:hypothetical protein [Clostridia bacterium]